jgi:radical SAM superfamily enzyme YgiQ (UPF0313 family)
VVLGGIHPTVLPEEASAHADAVVIGEAETLWPRVVADFQTGRLQRFTARTGWCITLLPFPGQRSSKLIPRLHPHGCVRATGDVPSFAISAPCIQLLGTVSGCGKWIKLWPRFRG